MKSRSNRMAGLLRLTVAMLTAAAVALAGAAPAVAADTIEGRFDVGGHHLYLQCTGTGSPTIVYLHGAVWHGGYLPHANGLHTAERLSGEHRVCVYDRRNGGLSDAVDAEQRPQEAVHELRSLLRAAGVQPPYVLLGASFGGLLSYIYLNTYPRDVAGMVLLDSPVPDELFHEHLFRQQDREWRYKYWDHDDACCSPERISHYKAMRWAFRYIGREPAVPMTYFYSSQEPPLLGVPAWDAIAEETRVRFVSRFPQGKLVYADAPHFMEPAIPDDIATALREVIAAASG